MKFVKWIWSKSNLWIALLLITANLAAWSGSPPAQTWPEPQPVLDPQIAALMELNRSGGESGQPIHLEITQEGLSNTLAWFLLNSPNLPFSQPYLEIKSNTVSVRAYLHVAGGMRTAVYAQVNLRLENKQLKVELLNIGAAGTRLPAAVVVAIQAQLEPQLARLKNLAFYIDILELGEGSIRLDGHMK